MRRQSRSTSRACRRCTTKFQGHWGRVCALCALRAREAEPSGGPNPARAFAADCVLTSAGAALWLPPPSLIPFCEFRFGANDGAALKTRFAIGGVGGVDPLAARRPRQRSPRPGIGKMKIGRPRRRRPHHSSAISRSAARFGPTRSTRAAAAGRHRRFHFTNCGSRRRWRSGGRGDRCCCRLRRVGAAPSERREVRGRRAQHPDRNSTAIADLTRVVASTRARGARRDQTDPHPPQRER
jgi:hypothetical protein